MTFSQYQEPIIHTFIPTSQDKMDLIERLSKQFSSSSVGFQKGEGELACCQIDHPRAKACIYLNGAHLTNWQPQDEQPVLWMSDNSAFETGKPIRGGIPICWPWFGPHPAREDLPQHGFARLMTWNLRSVIETEEITHLILGFNSKECDPRWTKDEFDVRYALSVGKELRVELSVTNTGNQPMQDIGCALHTYFSISSINSIQIRGLEGVSFLDKLTGKTSSENSPLSISQETDRVYYPVTETVEMIDEGFQRKISVAGQGSKSTVVWNPWVEKSKRMADFPDAGFQTMVCIETANALEDTRTISPSETHTVSQTITVS